MAIVVLLTTSWPGLQEVLPQIVAAVASATRDRYSEVSMRPR